MLVATVDEGLHGFRYLDARDPSGVSSMESRILLGKATMDATLIGQ